jgi:membrane fusion protein (multidrug efflux system)
MKRLALFLFLSLLAACSPDGKNAPAGPGAAGAMPPPEVDVMQVGRGAATLTRELPGRVIAVRTAQVRARVEGIEEKRLFEASRCSGCMTASTVPPRRRRKPMWR